MEKIITFSSNAHKSVNWRILKEVTKREELAFLETVDWTILNEIHIFGSLDNSIINNNLAKDCCYYYEEYKWLLIIGTVEQNKIFEYIRKFGYGSKTGVDLLGESKGIIFNEKNISMCDWKNLFDFLSKQQQILLIKSELIRTYDALPNIDKTRIKKKFNLSTFASKWYKLPSSDKNKLLKFVL